MRIPGVLSCRRITFGDVNPEEFSISDRKIIAGQQPPEWGDDSASFFEFWRIRSAAIRFYNIALRRGVLVKPKTCSRCGSDRKVHGHHTDYNKPLHVIWLCAKCHNAEHRRLRAEVAA